MAEAEKFRRPDQRQTFADLPDTIHLLGEMRSPQADRTDIRFKIIKTGEIWPKKTLNFYRQDRGKASLPRLTPIQTPRPNAAARVGNQFKRRASAAFVQTNAACPYLAPIQTRPRHPQGLRLIRSARILRQSKQGCPILVSRIECGPPAFGANPSSIPTICAHGRANRNDWRTLPIPKPSHSGNFRKSAMRETKNASPAGGNRFNRIPLWASTPSTRGFCRRCSTR